MNWMVICVGAANIYVSENIREALHETGVAMLKAGNDNASFKTKSAEGRIRKERDYIRFLGDGGPFFVADIETDLGKGNVRFIIPDRYLQALDEGVEFKGRPVHLDNSTKRSAKAMWN